jgi:acyl dehydratase
MLLYSTICQVLSTQLPGPGTLQIEQSLMFTTPTFAEEEMTVQVEVVQAWSDEGIAVLDTNIVHRDGRFACRGQTIVGQHLRHLSGRSESNSGYKTSESEEVKGLFIGQKDGATRTFRQEDLVEYAELTGDKNPLFTNTEYSRQAGLQDSMVPGGLLGGLFSYLLGTKLPGRGTNWLKQHLVFNRPAYVDEEIIAEVKIIRLRSEKRLVNLNTQCTRSTGEVICTGEALVLVQEMEDEGNRQSLTTH